MARMTPFDREQKLRAVYRFLRSFLRGRGYSPSLREIAEATEQSVGGVYTCLDMLEEQGLIERKRWQKRAIALCDRWAEKERDGSA